MQGLLLLSKNYLPLDRDVSVVRWQPPVVAVPAALLALVSTCCGCMRLRMRCTAAAGGFAPCPTRGHFYTAECWLAGFALRDC